MYTSINFLKERNRMQELTLIRDKKIAAITSLILGIFLFITMSLFIYQLYLGSKLRTLEATTAQRQQQLKSLSSLQTNYAAVTKKLSTVSQIQKKRGNKWGAITYFYSLLPSGAKINSVDLQADVEDSLSFSIAATNVFTYEQLSKVLQSDTSKNSGFTLDLGTLSRTKDGNYRMDITLTTQNALTAKGKTGK